MSDPEPMNPEEDKQAFDDRKANEEENFALTECNACGKQIALSAETCPNCGAPGPIETNNHEGTAPVGAFVTFILCLIATAFLILGISYSSSATQTAAIGAITTSMVVIPYVATRSLEAVKEFLKK